tara:strand:- start:805 stop:1113 length:309 start_codon:yes stop_codon:yes gene_type:complete
MSSDPIPEEEHLQDLYNEIRSFLEGCDHISPTGQAVVLLRIAIENGGGEIGMTGILHVISSMMTQTLGIMSDAEDEGEIKFPHKDELEDILRDFNQNKTSEH